MPAEEIEEAASEEIEEEATAEAEAPVAVRTVEYDRELLALAEAEDDWLVTPIASFEETRIVVTDASRYELTLVNCALEPAEPEAEPLPAQDFEGSTEFVKVSVSAPEGAFPEGTTMTVVDVEDEQTLTDIEQTVSEDFVEVKRVHAVDITFFNAAGEEIEPLAPIAVVISVAEIEQQQDAVVVHVDDAGAAEVVESQSEAPAGETELTLEMPATEQAPAEEAEAEPADEEPGQAVAFEADSFSVYAVVVTETIETRYIDDSGDTWRISVGYGPEANIPSGATLKVEEVPAEDYLSQAEATLAGGKRVTLARFFDIKIMDGEDEVQPEQPVTVNVTLLGDAPQDDAPADAHRIDAGDPAVCAMHFEGEQPSVVAAAETDEAVVFDAEGFSVWGVVYTVDFYYGNYEYHLNGEGSMTLSALFDALKIEADAAQAADVVFTNPELVAVERLEDGSDWTLTSLAPFDSHEKLTVKMSDGTVYDIRVEDAQYRVHIFVNDTEAGSVNTEGKFWTQNDGTIYTYVPTANPGYHFVCWCKDDGTVLPNYQKTDLLSGITLDRETSIIAYFAPDEEYLIRYQAVGRGSIRAGNQYVEDHNNVKHYFSYSDDEDGNADADPGTGYTMQGWYLGDDQSSAITTETRIYPTGIQGDSIFTARFREKTNYTIQYTTNKPNTAIKINGSETVYSDFPVSEIVLEGEEAKGAYAYAYGVSATRNFLGWADSSGTFIANTQNYIPTGNLIKDEVYTAVFSSKGEYIKVICDSAKGEVHGDQTLVVLNQEYCPPNKTNNIVYAGFSSQGGLHGNVWPVSKNGYEFDHWEYYNGETTISLTGETAQVQIYNGLTIVNNEAGTKKTEDNVITTENTQVVINTSYKGLYTLTAVFKPKITYDIGVINWVGINTPDYQEWYSAAWCPTPTINRSGLSGSDDIYTETVSYGSDLTLPTLSRDIRVTQTKNKYNYLTHSFMGWRLDIDVTDTNGTTYASGSIIPAGTTIHNVTEGFKAIAVWSAYFPGKTGYYGGNVAGPRYNTNTVGFFVRLFDSVFNIGDTKTYTDCLFTTRLTLSGTGTFTQGSSNGSRFDYFGNSKANQQDDINAIDAALRNEATNGLVYSWSRFTSVQAYQNHDSRYDDVVITLDKFPSDDFIFAQIRSWNLGAPEERKIQISGNPIDQDMITSDYFDIKWYVLKDQENQWHIDGMLIPKYAKLVIKKTFVGAQEAITSVKGSFNIKVYKNTDKDNTEDYTLTLSPQTDSLPNGYCDYDEETDTYTWELDDLLPLLKYKVVENGAGQDTKKIDGIEYKVTRSWQITNTPQTNYVSGSNGSATVNHVYSYPEGENWQTGTIQTVAFTNMYTRPYVMTIMKQDGTTLHGLADTTFDLVVKNGDTVVHRETCTSDKKGQITINFATDLNGTFSFRLVEREREGYASVTVEGTVSIDANGTVTLSGVTTSVSGDDIIAQVGVSDTSVIYVKNMPERKHVTVTKHWTDSTNKSVTMQLLRNGVPIVNEFVVLHADETTAAGVKPAKTMAWTYTWSDLPAYVDGREVVYTVRETWIGEPGGSTSSHYDGRVDADGYEEYIVNQSQTERIVGDNTYIDVYVENTKDDGQVRFSKIDTKKKAVAGAVFTLYEDSGNQKGPKKVNDAFVPLKKDGGQDYTVVSDSNGVVVVSGLAPGYYWIKETEAPAGYNLNPNWYLLDIEAHNSVIKECNQTDYWPGSVVDSVVDEPFTASIKVVKVGTDKSVPLSGAVFSLHRQTLSGNMAVAPMIGYGALTTLANGEVSLGELGEGTYYLKEETAPAGYILLNSPIKLVIGDDRRTSVQKVIEATINGVPTGVEVGTADEGVYPVYVFNNPGARLPSTGGSGTVPVYILGGALIALALVGLLIRRKARDGIV